WPGRARGAGRMAPAAAGKRPAAPPASRRRRSSPPPASAQSRSVRSGMAWVLVPYDTPRKIGRAPHIGSRPAVRLNATGELYEHATTVARITPVERQVPGAWTGVF